MASSKPVNTLDGHQARKRFGQNFLQDTSVIDGIVSAVLSDSAKATQTKYIEIGPGLGALTGPLFAATGQLTVLELDKDLAAALPMRLGVYEAIDSGAFGIVQTDALRYDFKQLADHPTQQLSVVGNLPYNISTPIIFHLLSFAELIADMHFMLQKEVVDRITAEPNTSAFGRLSVMVQYYCQTQFLFEVPPHSFIPAPKVMSAVFRLIPHSVKPVVAKDEKVFSQLVSHMFTMRRKTLRSILKGKLDDADFSTVDIDPMLRPENLSVADFVKLADCYALKLSAAIAHAGK